MYNWIVKKHETAAAITEAVNAGTCKTPEQAVSIAKERGDTLFWTGAPIPEVGSNADADDIERVISDILLDIGMPPHLTGYRYTREAIKIALKNENVLNHGITKELYPAVAKNFDTTPSRAERSIRKAIESAFDRGNSGAIDRYLFGIVRPDKGKAANGEFIAAIVEYIRMNNT